MKHIALAILLILVGISAAPTTVAQHNPDAEVVEFKVKGVTHGTTYATVLKQLGKPQKQQDRKERSEECAGPGTFRTMDYGGMEIGLMGDIRGRKMKVFAIGIDSAKWNVDGITIGASEADLTAKFGKPRNRFDLDYEVVVEYETVPDYIGLSFHFKDKKLYKIVLAESLC